VRRQIYLPLAVGLILLFAALAGLAVGEIGDASTWADIALAYLLVLMIVAALVFLAAVALLAYGVTWLIGNLPGPAWRVQQAVGRVRVGVRRGADLGVRPLVLARSMWAAVVAVVQSVESVFKG
jgi:hypothetical protein